MSFFREHKTLYRHMRGVIAADFPIQFRPSGPVPLAIGIHRDLARHYKGRFTSKQIRIFLKFWCSRREYHEAVASGQSRVGLAGEIRGITGDHRDYHIASLAPVERKQAA